MARGVFIMVMRSRAYLGRDEARAHGVARLEGLPQDDVAFEIYVEGLRTHFKVEQQLRYDLGSAPH